MELDLADLKYVVVISHGLEIPLMAPQLREHAQLWGGVSTVVSAGFFRLVADPGQPGRMKVLAFGESIGLGRTSRGEQDARIIERFLLPWQA
jgi:hypothetical protein